MGKIAFVFSGQGDQYPGMGKELYETYPVAKKVYETCDALRQGTIEQCFQGTEEELKQTKNTQPCIFAMELAAASVLIEKGIEPNMVAGFSLGEVVAATFSGIFDTESGFRLVCKRGELMQQEAEKHETSMAAVMKLTVQEVEKICENYSKVYPVNFNCPGQISVSGEASQMADFFADIKAAGGKVIPLKVKGAFHSPYMDDAARNFKRELEKETIQARKITLYSNVTAEPYGEDIVDFLSKQICSPVQWENIVRNMIEEGVDQFVEIGPGRTLTNMIRKINAEVKAVTIMEYLKEIEGEDKVC